MIRYAKIYPFIIATTVLFLSSIAPGCGGCNGCSEPKDWVYTSKKAPYHILLSGNWKKENPNDFNEFADLAVSRGPLRAVVIPQKLQPAPGAPEPALIDIKAASLRQMEADIKDLVVEDEINTIVGEQPAYTLFSQGKVDHDRIFYTITYLSKDGWTYQIICWSPLEFREALTQASGELIAGWNRNQGE